MPTPLEKQGTPPYSEASAMGQVAVALKYKEIHLMTAYTHTHKHTYTHAHTLPTEQRTNAHNTFSEPLTAIVAHQVLENKQKSLPPLTTDIAYIAFYYLLC